MHELDDNHWEALRQLHELASLADMETDAALYSGTLDDALTAIQALVSAADALSLPDGLARDLQSMAQEALKAANGDDAPQDRATLAMRAVGHIEQTIESHFASGGRRL